MDEIRRDVRPLLLKVGVALALSLAGYLHFSLRPRRLPFPPPPPRHCDGGLKDDLSSLTTVEALPPVVEEEESFLLPEFDQLLLKEFGQSEREMETINEPESEKELAMEQEVAYLRNLVESLQERERTLEIQLFEYQGLREQESVVKELENRLKIMGTEAKLFALKTEMLQVENQKLRDQVLDHSRTVADLDIAKQKIRLLERKLRLVGDQAKEDICTLQQQVALLQEREHSDRGDDAEARIKELEDVVIKLRKMILDLAKENSELQLKLEASQEAESTEEVERLREENSELKTDIDKLHTGRFSDVEELVYLRWINACLRYEMRSCQPPPGKAVARDLSKSLSPRSEQKAKQLILDYANFSIDEKTTSAIDFDWDYSSSQASEELDDTSVDVSSTAKDSSSRKAKFISKLKKLVLGKDRNIKKYSSFDITPDSHDNSERKGYVSPHHYEDTTGRISNCSSTSSISEDPSSGVGLHGDEQQLKRCTRSFSGSLEIPRPTKLHLEETKLGNRTRCKSDIGTSYRVFSGDDRSINTSPHSLLDHVDIDDPVKVELKKFAEALKSTQRPPKLKKRAASFTYS